MTECDRADFELGGELRHQVSTDVETELVWEHVHKSEREKLFVIGCFYDDVDWASLHAAFGPVKGNQSWACEDETLGPGQRYRPC